MGNKKRKNNRNNKRNKIKKDKAIDNVVKTTNTDDNEPIADEELEDLNTSTSVKRNHPEDDSDAEESEDTPKRKKKKKQSVPVETSDNKKGKKSIRQMKKERHVERLAEAQAASKDVLKSQCESYLSQWKHDRSNWKFMKAKQVWLYKNKFSSHLVPETSWPTLLEYFESAKGNIRNMLLEDANKTIKQMDEWTESQKGKKVKDDDETEESTDEQPKPDDTSYKRARDLIQCLQE